MTQKMINLSYFFSVFFAHIKRPFLHTFNNVTIDKNLPSKQLKKFELTKEKHNIFLSKILEKLYFKGF